jgi:glutamate synthase (NADPH/NADH)
MFWNWQNGFFLQDFQLEKRLDNELIEAAAPVLQGVKSRVDLVMKISNEDRAFASTLSYHISMYVSKHFHRS